jgi:Protein of unknown function (DUF1592)/Protein of unknown function (DUF1588)/Protein of unknown function (DUF1585)/Protein of unknown function (DUF1595)/Protein of unknown function (DUF1587)
VRVQRASSIVFAVIAMSGSALLGSSQTSRAQTSATAVSQAPAAAAAPGIMATRRLTELQYRQSIADVFGADIEVNGRFEPEQREHLLLAIGGSMLSISAAGFDQYFAIAKGVSDQVLDDTRRARILPCQPASDKGIDDQCTAQFVKVVGRRLFRRPLANDEVQPRVALASAGTGQSGDYYSGLKLALTSLLSAPQFLFRIETAERDVNAANGLRLDGYTKAARLSYLLWNTTPDEELLLAAETGEIHTSQGLNKQVSRLLGSSRVEAGTRAFFSDMLQLDLYDSLTKDPMIFPKFSQAVSDAAKEQTLKTVVDHLLAKDADYRDLFTTRTTFLDRSLASIYKVPLLAPDGWVNHEFPPESDQSGILTHISFLGLFSHPGRSSPTKRGVAINEILLCEPTPLPPANVDFSIVNDTSNPNLRTVRSRLVAHSEDESCSGCHRKSDPLGLALERFDSLGQHRTKENGVLIDVTAELSGMRFDGARGLGEVLRENPKVPACVVRNVYAYGTGRAPDKTDRKFLDERVKAFIGERYRFRSLLKQIVTTPEFFKVVTPKPALDEASKPKSTIAVNTEATAGARPNG